MEPHNFSEVEQASFLINKLKSSDTLKKLSPNLNQELDARLNIYRKNKISLVMIGETSAGKTSLMNSIISYNSQNNSFSEEILRFLPSESKENTTYLWIVESSEDSYFYLELDGEMPKIYKKQSMAENIKDIKEDILKLNEDQKKEIDKITNRCKLFS